MNGFVRASILHQQNLLRLTCPSWWTLAASPWDNSTPDKSKEGEVELQLTSPVSRTPNLRRFKTQSKTRCVTCPSLEWSHVGLRQVVLWWVDRDELASVSYPKPLHQLETGENLFENVVAFIHFSCVSHTHLNVKIDLKVSVIHVLSHHDHFYFFLLLFS